MSLTVKPIIEIPKAMHEEDLDLRGSAFEGMTNGEVIKAIYRHHSDMNCGSNGEYVHIWSNDGKCQMTIHKGWWNAPYKAESEG